MKGTTHIDAGLMSGLFITKVGAENLTLLSKVPITTPIHYGCLIAGSMIGAVLTDADIDTSKAGRKLWIISKPLKFLNKFFNKIKLRYFAKLVGHRGILHFPIVWAICTFLLFGFMASLPLDNIAFGILAYFIFGVQLGYFSHLVLDTFNTEGIPWFAPFSLKGISILKIKYNGKLEMLFSFIIGLISIYLILNILGIVDNQTTMKFIKEVIVPYSKKLVEDFNKYITQ